MRPGNAWAIGDDNRIVPEFHLQSGKGCKIEFKGRALKGVGP